MKVVNLHAAKTNLSRLVDDAVKGDEVVIAKSGKPLVRLVPIEPTRPRAGFGVDRGMIRIREDFDAPLPRRIRNAFGVKP